MPIGAVRALAESIGPRPACSPAEKRGVEWCADRLKKLGYDVDVEEFRSRRTSQTAFLVTIACSFFAAIVIPYAPIASLILGIVALLFYALHSDGRSVIPSTGANSHNVFAKGDRGEPHLVVIAHVDSPPSSLLFHPRFVRVARPAIQALRAVLFLIPLLAVIVLIGGPQVGDALAVQIPTWFLMFFLFLHLALLFHAEFVSNVPGANSNASGVEVLLRLASSKPSEVWFVITGSEAVGMLGIQSFLKEHQRRLKRAKFLNLSSVGGGSVTAVASEGAFRARQSDEDLLGWAQEAGAEVASFRLMPTDATPLLVGGRAAMSLMGLDQRGLPPNYLSKSDTVDRIDPTTVDRATEVARHIIASCRKAHR